MLVGNKPDGYRISNQSCQEVSAKCQLLDTRLKILAKVSNERTYIIYSTIISYISNNVMSFVI